MDEFERIYRKHLDAVFRYAVHSVGRRDVAEEITSEAFLALYRNLDRIDEAQLPAWLFTVARNRAIDYWRRQSVEQRHAGDRDEPVSTPEPAPASWLLDSKALKPVHRVCLTLRYVDGMSLTEVARATGLSETQVKGSLQYARQLLRKELAEDATRFGWKKRGKISSTTK